MQWCLHLPAMLKLPGLRLGGGLISTPRDIYNNTNNISNKTVCSSYNNITVRKKWFVFVYQRPEGLRVLCSNFAVFSAWNLLEPLFQSYSSYSYCCYYHRDHLPHLLQLILQLLLPPLCFIMLLLSDVSFCWDCHIYHNCSFLLLVSHHCSCLAGMQLSEFYLKFALLGASLIWPCLWH